MKRLYSLACALSLLASACGLANGTSPTVPVSQTESEATPVMVETSTQPIQTPSPEVLETEDLTLPPMPDGSDGTEQQDWVEVTLAEMSLEEKIGQMIVAGINGDAPMPDACAYIQQLRPAGVILQGAILPDPISLRAFIIGLQECAREVGMPPLLVALAHEGEYVNRFRSGTTPFPAALALGATGDPQVAYQTARASGRELAYSGVNLVLGPVADVLVNHDNEIISQRTYGGDAGQVSKFVSQAVQGYLEAGLIPVLKHFPGHGGVAGDSHRLLPVDRASLEELRAEYLPPFQSGLDAGASVVMLSHVSYPVLADGREFPATLSEGAVGLLREGLGFEGLIMSDAMRMKAVTQVMTSAEASLQGVQAGIDLLLVTQPEDVGATHTWLVDGFKEGRLTQERIDDAVQRVLILKADGDLVAPLRDASAPNWQANQELAFDIGERAVALLKEGDSLVPIPRDMTDILVIGPDEDWDIYPALEAELQDSGFAPAFARYPVPWEGKIQDDNLLANLPIQAANHDIVLLFTWQAHLNRLDYEDTWQAELVEKLRATGTPLIVVAIKSPTDILEFPQVSTYLAMFGTTDGQEGALIDILLGRAQPQGLNPLPGLLP